MKITQVPYLTDKYIHRVSYMSLIYNLWMWHLALFLTESPECGVSFALAVLVIGTYHILHVQWSQAG